MTLYFMSRIDVVIVTLLVRKLQTVSSSQAHNSGFTNPLLREARAFLCASMLAIIAGECKIQLSAVHWTTTQSDTFELSWAYFLLYQTRVNDQNLVKFDASSNT